MLLDVAIQKGIGLALVALFVALLTPLQMALYLSVFGQGHFLMAYLYLYKAGKVTLRGVILTAFFTAALFFVALKGGTFELFVGVVAILFMAHHAYDEFTLTGAPRIWSHWTEQAAAVLPALTIILDATFRTSLLPWGLAGTGALVLCLCILYLRGNYAPTTHSLYFGLLTVITVAVALFVPQPLASQKLIGGLIFFHYICWYVYYFYKLRSNVSRQEEYVRLTLLIHAVLFALLYLFLHAPWSAYILTFLFAPIYFYLWAAVHIAVSLGVAYRYR